MEFKPDMILSDKLEGFIQNYYRYRYLRDSGQSGSSNLGNLFNGYRELLDKENIAKYLSEQQTETIRLFNRLIIFFVQEYHCSGTMDRLFHETTIKKFKTSGTETTLNNALASIKSTKKRASRFNAGTFYKTRILNLLPELGYLTETLNESSSELGFISYAGLMEKNNNITITEVQRHCSTFLNDTDYIYKDLNKWYLNKYLDLKMDSVLHEDLLFLYNSFEFYEYFKEKRLLMNSTSSLGDMGIYISEGIRIDTTSRINKCITAGTYPVTVPGRIHISIRRSRSIEDFVSLYGELGTALFINAADREESFTQKRLIDVLSLYTFKSLFSRMVQEKKWIERYLKIKTDRNFTCFLALRQLSFIRELCIKVLISGSLYKTYELNNSLSEIESEYRKNMHLKVNEGIVLSDIIINQAEPCLSLVAMIIASYMEKLLVEKYDEQWWRDRRAGEEILKLWKMGAGLTQSRIREFAKADNSDTRYLTGRFEDVFK